MVNILATLFGTLFDTFGSEYSSRALPGSSDHDAPEHGRGYSNFKAVEYSERWFGSSNERKILSHESGITTCPVDDNRRLLALTNEQRKCCLLITDGESAEPPEQPTTPEYCGRGLRDSRKLDRTPIHGHNQEVTRRMEETGAGPHVSGCSKRLIGFTNCFQH